jgi:ADP-ribose pyrophosphatase
MVVEETISTKQIFDGHIVKLRIDTVETASGKTVDREIVEHGDVVAVVPIDEDDNVLLVKQYRKPVEQPLLEIPAGGVDEGEDPLDSVARELQEEIGLIPRKIDKLGGFYTSPGYCTEYLHLYVATKLKPSRLEAEDTESIEVVKVPLSKVSEMINSGEINDAKSIVGLLRVISLGLRGS